MADIDTRVMRIGSNTECMAVTDFLSGQGVEPEFPAGLSNVTMLVAVEVEPGRSADAYAGQQVLGAMMIGVNGTSVEVGAFAVDHDAGEERARAAVTVLGEKVLILGEILVGEDLGPEAEAMLFHDLGKRVGMEEFMRPDAYTAAA